MVVFWWVCHFVIYRFAYLFAICVILCLLMIHTPSDDYKDHEHYYQIGRCRIKKIFWGTFRINCIYQCLTFSNSMSVLQYIRMYVLTNAFLFAWLGGALVLDNSAMKWGVWTVSHCLGLGFEVISYTVLHQSDRCNTFLMHNKYPYTYSNGEREISLYFHFCTPIPIQLNINYLTDDDRIFNIISKLIDWLHILISSFLTSTQ